MSSAWRRDPLLTMNAASATLVLVAYQSMQALEELSAFVAVVEAQGFSAAARSTRGRKATLSRRVQDLEARLGVPLLVRTTRSLRLTEEGQVYFEHARRSLAAARDAEASVLSAKEKPSGTLRVTMSASLAAVLFEHVITSYLARYPDVSVHLDTSERRIDLSSEGFDLALRTGPLDDSGFVARKLGVKSGGFYASPRYLAKHGKPERPRDVTEHATIVIPKSDGAAEWPFVIDGKRRLVQLRPRLSVTNFEFAARAAALHLGIVRLPLYFAHGYLAKKQLVPVLEPWTLPAAEVYAVYPPGGASVPKTRVFLEQLAKWFGSNERSS